MRSVPVLALLLALAARAEELPLAPFEFLAGHCWRGEFPDGAAATHCYTWVFGGKHLRDVLVVRGDAPEYRGETIYSVDGAGSVVFRYWNSHGAVSEGRMLFADGTIVSPAEEYVGEDGQPRQFRSTLKRLDHEHYEALTEEHVDGQWTGFSRVEFARIGVATEAASAAERQAREVVERFVAAFNSHDLPTLLALAHPDFEWLSVEDSEVAAETQGVDALESSLSAYFESCGTCRSTVEISSVNGPWVTAVETATWESSGVTQAQSSTSVYEIVAGKVRRVWYYPAVR